MKRGFIRALWGVFPEEWNDDLEAKYSAKKDNLFVRSRSKVENVIKARLNDKFSVPFVTYVFGKDNYEKLLQLGFDNAVMVNEDPIIYSPLSRRMWWHKLDILRYAMEEDGYDEIVYLDWDCRLVKELNPDFWDTLNKKEHFQACLAAYRGRNTLILKTRDKRSHNKIVPNGGFVYIRGKDVPSKISSFRTIGKSKWLDEAAYAKYLDDICGGWIGTEQYKLKFEPDACWFRRGLFTKEDFCFRHY